MGKVFLLVILMSCFAYGDAKAKSYNARSIKNFFVEEGLNVRQLGRDALLV